MKAQLLEVKVNGTPFKALILNGEQLAVLAALTGSVGGSPIDTWRKLSDEIYWTCMPHVEVGGHRSPLHEKVLRDLDGANIEATTGDIY